MKPRSIEELQEIILTQTRIVPTGAGSKTALDFSEDGVTGVSTASLSGVLDYSPDEFTFTALAGTGILEVEQMLAEHGQYLPFDPPLVRAGATLGGTVAAGLSGPGRYRYGGLRDFLLGVRFFDGQGNLVRSGGKVVKNAAGFDLSKFMVGSLGGYGFLVELSFKVMPRAEAHATVIARLDTLKPGVEAMVSLTRQPLEIYSLELTPAENGEASLMVRVGGATDSLAERVARLKGLLGDADMMTLEGRPEQDHWRRLVEFDWSAPEYSLVKIPLTPKHLLALDQELAARAAGRFYSAGANQAWVAWPGEIEELEVILVEQGLSGLVILGEPRKVRLGARSGESFARRVKQALDPDGKYVTI